MLDLRRRLLSLFFRLLYNEFAWSYDVVAFLVSLGRWQAWGQTTVHHLRGPRVLDLGHGPGHLLLALERVGFAPVGLDLSPSMGRQTRRRARRAGLDVPQVRARAERLPFRSRAFDSVVATFPTEFIVDPSTLRQVARILTPGGRLVIAGYARFDGTGLMSRFLTWLYDVTGQNKPSPDLRALSVVPVGFSWHIAWEEVGSTSIMLVIADKA